MKQACMILLAVLLPVSVAVWVIFFPNLTEPWWALIHVSILVASLTWFFARWLNRIPHLEDRSFSLFLAAVYLIIPAGALILLLNQSGGLADHSVSHVVMNRYPETPDGSSKAWIFLWTGNDVYKMKVSSSDALYLCQPGDSVAIYYRRGILGLEYRDHVDRIP